MRKGQYLALESLLSVTLGIALAVGSITLFSDYKSEVLSSGESKQVDLVESEVISAMYTLRESENGQITLDLSDQIGGRQYDILLDENLQIATQEGSYETSLQGLRDQYDFSGSATGGSVKVFKNGNEFVLREQ